MKTRLTVGALSIAIYLFLTASQCGPLPPLPPIPWPTVTPYPGDPTPIHPTYAPTTTPTATPPPTITPTVTVTPTIAPTPTEPAIFYIDRDVSAWPETSKIISTSHNAGQICIDHSMRGVWPGRTSNNVSGNPWIIGKINGKWQAFTYEWNGFNQQCKSLDVRIIGQYCNAAGCPRSWSPSPGEKIGLFVSTYARAGVPINSQVGLKDERSNIEWVVW